MTWSSHILSYKVRGLETGVGILMGVGYQAEYDLTGQKGAPFKASETQDAPPRTSS